MKNFLTSIALACLFSCTAISQDQPEPQSQPKVSTYSLLPSATLNLQNRSNHIVEIRTEYPVQLAAGPCHIDSTVQWRCYFKNPADLFIRDLRIPPLFKQPKANTITVTFWED